LTGRGSAFERFEAQRHVEKLMFLDMWLGFGWAVVVQGAFLLAQDIGVYRLHRRNFRRT